MPRSPGKVYTDLLQLSVKKTMQKLAFYFSIDHIKQPNAAVLQQNVMLNIMYYLCCRGQENIHSMTKDWFDVVTEPNGERYIVQVCDEMDKNHKEKGYRYDKPGTNVFSERQVQKYT